ncbi:hypothetical protein LTR37_016112 [Vermiconidia calcicola]|uniref:Uncharacterized protein n=1 Tax=Vermiconidia calcicola TaxID=1690605 RepID=A0ACC3MNR2_9PEZI|nr:hypothetical protein LTR37_016112 [Vermiconidia calcicola]
MAAWELLIPPDLEAWRSKLFHVETPIIMTFSKFNQYWPFVSNMWMEVAKRHKLKDGSINSWCSCRCHRDGTRNREVAGGVGLRNRSYYSLDCKVALKISRWEKNDEIIIQRTGEHMSPHSHSLAYMDQRSLNKGLHAIVKSVVDTYKFEKPAEICRYLKEGEHAKVFMAAGAEYLTWDRVRNTLNGAYTRPVKSRKTRKNLATSQSSRANGITNPSIDEPQRLEVCDGTQ